ncbi:hypothetical protein CLV84_2114 [Neolewinella xylanilytica]|uniref:Uncharacterized protein n=1 Tax=Neolewinella xylanilytica TaxID=1514080 RepID=A0A2S6I218_9BACT|nr:hypothetical protein [Neolewinella xylanilytica]PPK85222.1 hypothetical protein CLV84_2114 [Neolewinella xylanilytica]
MRIPKIFTRTSLVGLLSLTACEREEPQLAIADQPTDTSPLEAEFSIEDADQLELTPRPGFHR